MYFVLSNSMGNLVYLKYGLSLVLIYVGFKMLAMDYVKIPVLLSLLIIASLIGGSVVASLIANSKAKSV